MSGVIAIGSLLTTIHGLTRREITFVLTCLVVLALPTAYILFDTAKDPNVWDPAFAWPRYAAYVVILPKVLPTLGLFIFCMRKLLAAGLTPSAAVLSLKESRKDLS